MRGLLTKDISILFQRKKTFIFLVLWAIVMSYTMEDASFVVGWLTMISAFFSISSLTYDEYDNSMPFLMTLPIDAKIYAVEKYLFGFMCGITSWLFGTIIYFIIASIKNVGIDLSTNVFQILVMIPLFVLLIDICLPINLKFGSERGRTIITIFWGIIFASVMFVGKIFTKNISIDPRVLSMQTILILLFLITVILTVISVLISVRVMNKKEF